MRMGPKARTHTHTQSHAARPSTCIVTRMYSRANIIIITFARAHKCVYVCVLCARAAVLTGQAGLEYRSEEDLADKAEDFPANY